MAVSAAGAQTAQAMVVVFIGAPPCAGWAQPGVFVSSTGCLSRWEELCTFGLWGAHFSQAPLFQPQPQHGSLSVPLAARGICVLQHHGCPLCP